MNYKKAIEFKVTKTDIKKYPELKAYDDYYTDRFRPTHYDIVRKF